MPRYHIVYQRDHRGVSRILSQTFISKCQNLEYVIREFEIWYAESIKNPDARDSVFPVVINVIPLDLKPDMSPVDDDNHHPFFSDD